MTITSYKIENLISDSYEFEIFITDIWCLYLSDKYNLEYEMILITSPGNDGGIDAIVISKDFDDCIGKEYYFLQISKAKKQVSHLFTNFTNNVEKFYKRIIGEEWNTGKRVCMTIQNKPSSQSKDINYICGQKLRKLVDLVAKKYELIDEHNNLNEAYKKNIQIRAKIYKHMNIYTRKNNMLSSFNLYNDYILYNFKCIKDKQFGVIELVEELINIKLESISGILGQDFSIVKLNLLDDIFVNNNIKRNSTKRKRRELVDFVLEIKEKVETKNNKIELEVYAKKSYIGLKYNSKVVAYFSYNLSGHFAFSCKSGIGTSNNSRIMSSKDLIANGYRDNNNYNKDTYLVNPNLSDDKEDIIKLVQASLV